MKLSNGMSPPTVLKLLLLLSLSLPCSLASTACSPNIQAPQEPDVQAQESQIEQVRMVGLVEFPVNENGQTYGSSADAYRNIPEGVMQNEVINYLPDLVLVANSEGIEGYVLKEHYFPTLPKTPQEAVELASTSSPKEVPLLASDGLTVLGSWQTPTIGISDD